MINRVKTLHTTVYLKLMFGVTGLGGVIMHVVKNFHVSYSDISYFCLGKKIVEFKCECNRPIEKDCVTIVLDDGTEINIYSFMRIVDNNKLIFSITDYWLDNNITNSILELQKQLKGLKVEKIKFNRIGDCVIYLEKNKKLQVFIDATQNEPDYMCITKGQEYYVLCRFNHKLIIILQKD